MPVPNPVMPVKGAGTTLWVYKGSGDPYANPLSDVDWSRLAKVKDLTPGELTAESYDDSYLDDKDADWTATGQGQKSAGDTSFTLAWMPGEQGQQALLAWFNEGDTRAYKIRFPKTSATLSTSTPDAEEKRATLWLIASNCSPPRTPAFTSAVSDSLVWLNVSPAACPALDRTSIRSAVSPA